MQRDKDPQWLWSRRPGGVKYRIHLVNSVEKLWEIECASIKDPTLQCRFEIPSEAVNTGDIGPYLQQALFKFLQQNEERAHAERERRLAHRRAEFDRAVQAGGEWEPEGETQTARGSEGSSPAGDGGDREHLFAPYPEDSGSGAKRGVPSKPKAVARKASANRSRGRGSKGQTRSGADSDRRSEDTPKAG